MVALDRNHDGRVDLLAVKTRYGFDQKVDHNFDGQWDRWILSRRTSRTELDIKGSRINRARFIFYRGKMIHEFDVRYSGKTKGRVSRRSYPQWRDSNIQTAESSCNPKIGMSKTKMNSQPILSWANRVGVRVDSSCKEEAADGVDIAKDNLIKGLFEPENTLHSCLAKHLPEGFRMQPEVLFAEEIGGEGDGLIFSCELQKNEMDLAQSEDQPPRMIFKTTGDGDLACRDPIFQVVHELLHFIFKRSCRLWPSNNLADKEAVCGPEGEQKQRDVEEKFAADNAEAIYRCWFPDSPLPTQVAVHIPPGKVQATDKALAATEVPPIRGGNTSNMDPVPFKLTSDNLGELARLGLAPPQPDNLKEPAPTLPEVSKDTESLQRKVIAAEKTFEGLINELSLVPSASAQATVSPAKNSTRQPAGVGTDEISSGTEPFAPAQPSSIKSRSVKIAKPGVTGLPAPADGAQAPGGATESEKRVAAEETQEPASSENPSARQAKALDRSPSSPLTESSTAATPSATNAAPRSPARTSTRTPNRAPGSETSYFKTLPQPDQQMIISMSRPSEDYRKVEVPVLIQRLKDPKFEMALKEQGILIRDMAGGDHGAAPDAPGTMPYIIRTPKSLTRLRKE
jgi:hypothetical protein